MDFRPSMAQPLSFLLVDSFAVSAPITPPSHDADTPKNSVQARINFCRTEKEESLPFAFVLGSGGRDKVNGGRQRVKIGVMVAPVFSRSKKEMALDLELICQRRRFGHGIGVWIGFGVGWVRVVLERGAMEGEQGEGMGYFRSSGVHPDMAICQVVEDLQSISVCGHVFHELCLLRWFEYSASSKKLTCPVCKQSCASHNAYRLYFQSTGDATDPVLSQSRSVPVGLEESPDVLRREVEKLESKVFVLNFTLDHRQGELKQTSEEVVNVKDDNYVQTRRWKMTRLLDMREMFEIRMMQEGLLSLPSSIMVG